MDLTIEKKMNFPCIYRGFLKDKKQLVYGNLIKIDINPSPLDYGINQDNYLINSIDYNSCPDWNLPYNRINNVVQKEDINICTMLNDRNTTPIFTGDYIKFQSNTIFEVKYDNITGSFYFINEEFQIKGNFIDCNSEDSLIVGNRHEGRK